MIIQATIAANVAISKATTGPNPALISSVVTVIATIGGVLTPVTANREYSDTLPSMNLVAEVMPDVLLRFGAAKVMSRPGLGSLTPGVTVSVSGGARTVTGGNPNLDPIRAANPEIFAAGAERPARAGGQRAE